MKLMSYISILVAFTLGCHDDPVAPGSILIPSDPDTRPITLSTPKLFLGVGIETGDFSLSWSESPDATYYTLESDMLPWFSIAKVVYSGPNRTYELGYRSDYLFSSYYRVRAESRNSRSSWSDTLKFPE